MPLSAGTVTVAADGTVSGAGYALALYNAYALGLDGSKTVERVAANILSDFTGSAADRTAREASLAASLLTGRQLIATKCSAQATAAVALIQTGTVVVPSTPGTYPVV
jgi:hypothetical protein